MEKQLFTEQQKETLKKAIDIIHYANNHPIDYDLACEVDNYVSELFLMKKEFQNKIDIIDIYLDELTPETNETVFATLYDI